MTNLMKDCKLCIAASFLFALLVTFRSLNVSSFVIQKEILTPAHEFDSTQWSQPMLRASRSRASAVEHQLAQQHLINSNQEYMTLDRAPTHRLEDDEEVFKVDLFCCQWRDLLTLFRNYKFRGISIQRQGILDDPIVHPRIVTLTDDFV